MNEARLIRRRVCFRAVPDSSPRSAKPQGRIPHVTRLMALAIRLEHLVRTGQVANYAALARLGYVSRARITQITHLAFLAPDIQEAILFLPRVQGGPAPITERDLRPIVAELDWNKQRQMWAQVHSKPTPKE